MVDYVLASQSLSDQFLFFNVSPFKATLSDCHCKLSWNILANFTIERHTKVDTYPMPTKYIWDENSSSLFQRSLAEPEIKNKIHVFVNSDVADINLAARALNDVMYDSYLLKDVHSVLVNFPREYAQESMMLYI